MTTYKHTDLESLSEDLRRIWQADDGKSHKEQLRELYLKISKEDLESLYDAADRFMYNYDRAFGEEILNDG